MIPARVLLVSLYCYLPPIGKKSCRLAAVGMCVVPKCGHDFDPYADPYGDSSEWMEHHGMDF